MRNRRVVEIGVLTLVFIAGAVLGRTLRAPATKDAPAEARSTSSANSAREGAAAAPQNASTSESVTQGTPAARSGAASLDEILRERDPRKRTAALEAYINGLGAGEFAGALQRMRQIARSSERELASRLLIAHWVQSDADGAFQFAASHRGYEYVADEVFQQLAATGFDSALQRAQAIQNPELRYNALRGVLSFLTETDPAGALRLAQGLGDFPGSEPLNSVIYRQWATFDPNAAALQASQDTSADGRRSPTGQVVRTWAANDPVAAANFALSLSNPEAQSRSIGDVMRQWGRQDPTSAASWINTLPAGQSHDSAVAALAYSMVSADPQNALGWVATIGDQTTRDRATERVAREVLWRDPANGAATLQAAGVPPTTIAQAQRRMPPGR